MTSKNGWSIVLLADSRAEIGAGHVMRSLTLGCELKARGRSVVLLSQRLPEPLQDRARFLGIEVLPRCASLSDPSIADEIKDLRPAVLLRDGYDFSAESVRAIDGAVPSTVVIDDNNEAPIGAATVLVNPNIHAAKIKYTVPSTTLMLLGTRYALVRKEVVDLKGFRREGSLSRTILVSMGGSDPRQILRGAVEAVSGLGAQVRSAQGLMSTSPGGFLFEQELGGCSLAVLSAGSQTWEAACLGIPVVSIATFDNQIRIAQSTEEAGFGVALDWRGGVDFNNLTETVKDLLIRPAELARMKQAALDVVDGIGVSRVASEINRVCFS